MSTSPTHYSVFRRLLVTMLAFGLFMGMIFPFAVAGLLGVRPTPVFFGVSVLAGLLVGAANYALFSVVVSRVIERLAAVMNGVVEHVVRAEAADQICPDGCLLELTSDDAVGMVETAFNTMTSAIAARIRRDAMLREWQASLTQSVELERVAAELLQLAARTVNAPAGLLYLDTGSQWELQARFGFDERVDLPHALTAAHGLATEAIRTGEIKVLRGQDWAWSVASAPGMSLTLRGAVLLPLRAEQRTVGIAVLALTESVEVPMDLLDALRLQAGPHLQNAWLHHRLANLAAMDELTQILNRRFGLRRLREEFQRSLRHGVPVAVMIVDVDHFKRVNDTFGHDAGDEVLREVARTIEIALRAGDVLCRYGGEEFLVMAPGAGAHDAGGVAERLRRTVESAVITMGERHLSVTVSVGLTVWPLVGASTVEELVSHADQALYLAKARGRNLTALRCEAGPVLWKDWRAEHPPTTGEACPARHDSDREATPGTL